MSPRILHVEGIVAAGLGAGERFVQLDWVRTQLRDKLGFEPRGGTFNLRMEGEAWTLARSLIAGAAGSALLPPPGFCAAKCFPVVLDGRIPGALVVPDVAGYPPDKAEVVAPVAIRESLGVRDGNRVSLRVHLDL